MQQEHKYHNFLSPFFSFFSIPASDLQWRSLLCIIGGGIGGGAGNDGGGGSGDNYS